MAASDGMGGRPCTLPQHQQPPLLTHSNINWLAIGNSGDSRMPKSKKKRVSHYNHHDAPRHAQQGGGVGKKMHTFSRLSSSSGAMSGKNGNKNESSQNQQQKKQRQHVRPTIPFRRRDRILLIGEGMYGLLV